MSRTECPAAVSPAATATTIPSASPIVPVRCASVPAVSSSSTRIVRRNCALGGTLLMGGPASYGRVLVEWAVHGDEDGGEDANSRRGEPIRGSSPLSARRAEARLPGVLRAARVDRDLARCAQERDLRVRLDAR